MEPGILEKITAQKAKTTPRQYASFRNVFYETGKNRALVNYIKLHFVTNGGNNVLGK
jgi:hypothetical protein